MAVALCIMANRLREICRLFSATRLASVRLGASSLPRWTHTAPGCLSCHRVPSEEKTARLRPQWRKAEMLLCRKYSEDSGMSLSELQEKVITVLKLFDKINPDKVSGWADQFVLAYFILHGLCTLGKSTSTLCE